MESLTMNYSRCHAWRMPDFCRFWKKNRSNGATTKWCFLPYHTLHTYPVEVILALSFQLLAHICIIFIHFLTCFYPDYAWNICSRPLSRQQTINQCQRSNSQTLALAVTDCIEIMEKHQIPIRLFRIISIRSKVSYFRLPDHVSLMEC
jgi:hypothetical protein